MPANSGLYQSPLLSQIAVDFKNRAYIADQILTPVSVSKMMGQYLEWDQGATFKLPNTQMAQDATPNIMDVKATKKPFTLQLHALAAYVDPLELSQAPEAQVRAMKVEKLANSILLDREVIVANKLTDSTVMTNNTTLSGSSQWSDPTSDPISAMIAQADALPQRPNVLITSRDVITKLRVHPKVITAIQYVERGGIAPMSALMDLFEVDKIIVGDAFKDTAAENLAATKVRIWGKHAILAYVDPSTPSALMDQPTLGYLPTLSTYGLTFQTYTARDPMRGSGEGVEFIKVETAYAPLITAPSMGFLWLNAVA